MRLLKRMRHWAKRRVSVPSGRRRQSGRQKPLLSVVVVAHDMARELPRTLHSLSAAYQKGVSPADYEVIVVDNGSASPVDPGLLASLRGRFRLIRIDPAPPSPAMAVNRGIAAARGDVIGVMIDGARMATPGLLRAALSGVAAAGTPIVTTLGWYLGADYQRYAVAAGYDRAREDALLEKIGWPKDGYRLFEIGTPDESSWDGWFRPVAESNALFLKRRDWKALGGMDERFAQPGGGLVNLDTYGRALELPGAQPVVLLGEATFHQLHGGIATNSPVEAFPARLAAWRAEYEAIRGKPWTTAPRRRPPIYVGSLPRPVLKRFVRAPAHPVVPLPAFEAGFDLDLFTAEPPAPPFDPVVAGLVELAHRELHAGHFGAVAGVARMARRRAPEEPEPQRLLSFVAAGMDGGTRLTASDFVALGDAHGILGETEKAAEAYRRGRAADPDRGAAHVGLAGLKLPGPDYYEWLRRFHTVLAPATVIEIGVFKGKSLTLARPPTLVIGVDPSATVESTIGAETHLFAETSDAFFARRGPEALLAGRPLGLGFIDGLHLFEQALRDFINLEAWCGRRSVVVIHDTLPLDEWTQQRSRATGFHTGDVWKLVPCLRHYRPDLDVFTIATAPTGLTVVTGFGAPDAARAFAERYDEAVARFVDRPFTEADAAVETRADVVPNDWSMVEARLEARGVLSGPEGAPVGGEPVRARADDGGAVRLGDRYLDLMVRILANTIYRDGWAGFRQGMAGGVAGAFDPALRERGLDWPAVAHTMVGIKRLENLRALAQRALDDRVPGDFIETGVWRGGCCILMRAVLAANGATDRRVYVADSFAGLPPPNEALYPADKGLDLSIYRELAIPLEQVKDNFSRYGLLDEQVVFVKGLFKDTLPEIPARSFALLRLDGDLYESTINALEALYPKLSPGGFVIVDDYRVIAACQRAVDDYRARLGIAAPIHEIDDSGVWWQKA
jgi:hypothetical protein